MNAFQLLLLGLFLGCGSVMAQPLTWGRDEGKMDWNDAMGLCQSKGMRLPTSDELVNAHATGANKAWESCKDCDYWSSTSEGKFFVDYVVMAGGSPFSVRREAPYIHARCVKQPGMISAKPDFNGTYTTDLGPLSLTQKGNNVTGEFEWTGADFREWTGSGTLVGIIRDGVLQFSYKITGSDDTQKGQFSLSADGASLTGVVFWIETSDDMEGRQELKKGPWNGTKN